MKIIQMHNTINCIYNVADDILKFGALNSHNLHPNV